VSEIIKRYLEERGRHELPEGWGYCPTCDRQVRLTKAGLVPGHYRRGEANHMGVPPCPARGVTP